MIDDGVVGGAVSSAFDVASRVACERLSALIQAPRIFRTSAVVE